MTESSLPLVSNRRRLVRVVGAAALTLLIAACGGQAAAPAGGAPAATATHSDFVACLMISATGVADRSFNQQAWEAMQKGQSQLGIQVKYLAQSGSTQYPQIGAQFVQQGCNMIIGMGYDTTATITTLSAANPDIKFAVVDDTLKTPQPNAVSLVYSTDQAGFLGGYLAAGMSKSGTVGVYGNMAIPPVELYMTGYVDGVAHYNKIHGTAVKVIGWDPVARTGQFAGSFTDVNKGKIITESELQQGADVIFPVAGPIDQGTAIAVREAGGPAAGKYMLWVDSDGCVSNPDYCDVILSTVQKNIAASLYDVLDKTVTGTFPTGVYTGTLANNGVGLAPFHNLTSAVPAALSAELDKLNKDLVSGAVKTS